MQLDRLDEALKTLDLIANASKYKDEVSAFRSTMAEHRLGSTMAEALVKAETMRDESESIKAKALTESKKLIADAEARAREILTEAEAQFGDKKTEVEQRLQEAMDKEAGTLSKLRDLERRETVLASAGQDLEERENNLEERLANLTRTLTDELI